ncbi:MAG: geranylgeranyl reductase family protein [Rhizobacter sp.]|nr:geranylgeranyl reductase family protein [Rhizobacter sp.]
MNLPLSELPDRCDVLVVGAGPAGSAAATLLARAGLNVVMVDQRSFPREKVCGDGLIPDAHAALAQLGLLDEVMACAQAAQHVACIGPRGGRIDVPGRVAVLPRQVLDHIVCRGAVRAGARMHAPVHFDAPLLDAAGRVFGASLSQGGEQRELRADWVVLASGAVPQALIAAGVCERQTPNGVALRAYVKNERLVGRITELEVVWHHKLRPGYGWIFPCPDGVFNIGVGVVNSHGQAADGHNTKQSVNLREVFESFCEFYAPARELMAGGVMQGGLKGAPLRFNLSGARYSRAGLLVTGEAAGSTYSFTGEGIGKALETGMLAAEAIVRDRHDDATVRQHYEAALRALKPRFELYERGNRVNAHPWLIDLLIWRARKSKRLLQRMSGVLNETSNPGQLFTFKGVTRLFTE